MSNTPGNGGLPHNVAHPAVWPDAGSYTPSSSSKVRSMPGGRPVTLVMVTALSDATNPEPGSVISAGMDTLTTLSYGSPAMPEGRFSGQSVGKPSAEPQFGSISQSGHWAKRERTLHENIAARDKQGRSFMPSRCAFPPTRPLCLPSGSTFRPCLGFGFPSPSSPCPCFSRSQPRSPRCPWWRSRRWQNWKP